MITLLQRLMKHRLLSMLLNSDMRNARFMLAIGALLWAVFLMWPGDLFPNPTQIANGTGRTTYSLMAEMAPEMCWATLFGIHGCFLLLSIFIKVPPVAALIDAFNGAALWSTATFACYASHFYGWATYQPPAAMSADLVMVFASWWWFVRVWADKNYEANH